MEAKNVHEKAGTDGLEDPTKRETLKQLGRGAIYTLAVLGGFGAATKAGADQVDPSEAKAGLEAKKKELEKERAQLMASANQHQANADAAQREIDAIDNERAENARRFRERLQFLKQQKAAQGN